jgi:hypothetical protein
MNLYPPTDLGEGPKTRFGRTYQIKNLHSYTRFVL